MNLLVDLLTKKRRFNEAEQILNACLDKQRQLLAPEHAAIVTTARRLDVVQEQRGAAHPNAPVRATAPGSP